jgi:hypothetical protein
MYQLDGIRHILCLRVQFIIEMIDKNYTFCRNALEWEKVIDISSFL